MANDIRNVPDGAAVGNMFQQDGALSTVLEGFETRRVQQELALQIEKTLRRGEVGFFEAGTGTGKSLAYLLPAAAYAMAEQKCVVVSTHTISLQEQLVNKDIPVVQRIFPNLRHALVKGWSNYICHLRLDARQFDDEGLFPDDEQDLAPLVEWAETTEDGTRSDLPFEPDENLWSQVCAESDSCLRSLCPYYNRCHFFKDRAKMADAHILVVNHHLLFADVALRKELGWDSEYAVLPRYDAVIIDEAHHVEDVATHHMGSTLAKLGIDQLFGRLYRRRQGKVRGILPRLAQAAEADVHDDIDWVRRIGEAKESVDRFFQQAVTCLKFSQGSSSGMAPKVRLEPNHLEEWQQKVTPLAMEATVRLAVLDGMLLQGIEELGKPEAAELLSLKGQAEAARRRLAGLSRSLAHFGEPLIDESVIWLEHSRRGLQRLVSAPIDVGPAVLDWTVNQCRTLVLLSATMAVNGRFDYQKNRLGLGGDRAVTAGLVVREALYESPFDFTRQAMLALPDDLPEPSDPGFPGALAEAAVSLVRASRGRALILFTSFTTLNEVKHLIEGELTTDEFSVIAQGDAPRTQVLDQFKAAKSGVLLGTDSFWEGVDIPGDTLSLVIVARLPFDVPTDPVSMARSQQVEAMGGSSFTQYALPRAVLKLKQGFGRLIRSSRDRGVVVICDRRVMNRSYGRVFLQALPSCRHVIDSTPILARDVASFLTQPGAN